MTVTGQQLLAGVALDLVAGDPRWLPHPVTGIGLLARWQERVWRGSGLALRLAGVAAWFAIVGISVGFVWTTLVWLPSPWIEVYWIYSFLALRSLDQHAVVVVAALRTGDLAAAREKVSYIVGRDTANLKEPDVTRAVIETVAENASDGVIAPLFWLLLGGPVAMAAYKAVNTLDSMFGYKNERYGEFGWWSARADDWANWIPARLTALMMAFSAWVLPGMSGRRALTVILRDAHRQPSPNSGYPEAAAAGALGVQLGGCNSYGGVASLKATLGDPVHGLTWRTWTGMRRLLYVSSLLLVLAALGVLRWQ